MTVASLAADVADEVDLWSARSWNDEPPHFVVVGPGAIGGLVAGRLRQAGHEVAVVARGEHLTAITRGGLRIQDAEGTAEVSVPVVAGAADVGWSERHVVLLAVQAQHTMDALLQLRRSAPSDVPVFSLQNGVENERLALRLFPNVYGVCVMCPATLIKPGTVQADSFPISGLLDVGRFPHGVDATAEAVSAALSSATFDSRAVADVMAWKYTKLLVNIRNAVQVVCPAGSGGELAARARAEAMACYQAAGIRTIDRQEEQSRRGNLLQLRAVAGQLRTASSTFQTIARGASSIETDYLNGEIVLLGRLHRVPVPVNELLQRLSQEVLWGMRAPAATSEESLLEQLVVAHGDNLR